MDKQWNSCFDYDDWNKCACGHLDELAIAIQSSKNEKSPGSDEMNMSGTYKHQCKYTSWILSVYIRKQDTFKRNDGLQELSLSLIKVIAMFAIIIGWLVYWTSVTNYMHLSWGITLIYNNRNHTL